MKRFFAFILSVCMVLSMCSCGNKTAEGEDVIEYKIAMITDYGDITDASFNQTIYEACKAFSDSENLQFTYFKPADDTVDARNVMVDKAVSEGFNIIVLPGYIFGETIVDVCKDYPDVKFIGIDISKEDLLSASLESGYNGNPDDYDLKEDLGLNNVYCLGFREELSGFMAGYSAVKLGYTELGYLGGKEIDAVMRYGYGFVQGCEYAAAENDTSVKIKYAYAGQFYGDSDITTVMDEWYSNGTEVIFACGGSVFTSVGEAASKVGGKVIGVDINQKEKIDSDYGEGTTVTSAMKGLYPSTFDTLTDIIVNGKWENYSGQVKTLGLISGNDPTLNYCQIPVDGTLFDDKYTLADYEKLVKEMYDEVIKVSGNVSSEPVTSYCKVEYLGTIK